MAWCFFSSWAAYLFSGDLIVRAAGVSGALAVALGALGEHVLKHHEKKDFYQAFQTANRYHYYHTLALMCASLVARPHLFAGLMISGMLLFSGSCYLYALTQNKAVVKITPWGGILLILGWLSVALP